MPAHGALPSILRALVGRELAPEEGAIPEHELAWLVRSGLGPVVWGLASAGQMDVPESWQGPLRAADLLARAGAQARLRATEEALGWFRREGLPPAMLLKGASIASRYYDQPHARIMGDVDLLLPPEAVESGVRILQARGFVMSTFAEPAWWDTHHHAPPLTHPAGDVTIELHRALIPPLAPTRDDPPFDLGTVPDRVEDACLGAEPVTRPVPELDLVLLAAVWANDLSTFVGNPGLQRPLVDVVLLLNATRETLDWDRVTSWVAGTATGDCLWTLLTFLERHGALPVDSGVLEALRSGPRRIDAGSVRVLHWLLARHVLVEGRFGRFLSRTNLARLSKGLFRPAPPWRRWLSAPGDVLLPPGRDERDPMRFLAGRARSALTRR